MLLNNVPSRWDSRTGDITRDRRLKMSTLGVCAAHGTCVEPGWKRHPRTLWGKLKPMVESPYLQWSAHPVPSNYVYTLGFTASSRKGESRVHSLGAMPQGGILFFLSIIERGEGLGVLVQVRGWLGIPYQPGWYRCMSGEGLEIPEQLRSIVRPWNVIRRNRSVASIMFIC